MISRVCRIHIVCLRWFLKKKSYRTIFFYTFRKCSLPMSLSKSTMRNIGQWYTPYIFNSFFSLSETYAQNNSSERVQNKSFDHLLERLWSFMHLKITTIFYSLLRRNAEVISRYLVILGNKFLQTSVRRNFSMARQNHDEINSLRKCKLPGSIYYKEIDSKYLRKGYLTLRIMWL